MDLEFKYGVMELNMKDNGKIIELRDRVNFGILVVIYMKENGKRIEHVVKEHIYILMVLNMKVNG